MTKLSEVLELELATRLLNLLADPVFVKDEAHRWVVVNDAFCKLLGRTRDELIGKSDYDFFPKEEADIYWSKDALVFESGETNENEEPLTDEAGTKYILSTKKSAFTGDDGKRRLVAVIRDLTERRRLERQLVESERLAAVGALAAGVAHDVNNPLTFVSANIALALETVHAMGSTPETVTLRGFLEDALDGANRVASIVAALSARANAPVSTEEAETVQSRGGPMDVESESRAVPTPERTPGSAIAGAEPGPADVVSKAKPHVLIVDDELQLRRLVGRTLAATYRVTVAGSGQEALDLIATESGAFDAVLCDLKMPGMSGLDLWDRVRAQSPDLADRFVFATGGIDEPMQRRLAATARPVLAKPYMPEQVRRAMRAAIR